MLWSGEPVLIQGVEEPCSLEEALAWNAGKANLSRCVKPRPGPRGMTILFAAFCMSCWSHTSGVVQDRCACTPLVNSATVSFVESECDVLRVYVRKLLLTCLSSRRSAS